MRLRGASRADLPALARLHAASFSPGWTEAGIAQLIGAGANAVVADMNGEICGFILTRQAADEAEILTICVDSTARRQGLGRALVGYAANVAVTSGARRMFLEVATGNAPALALYSGLGFVKTGVRKAYYRPAAGPSEDALVLVASLPLSGLGNSGRVD